MSQRRTKRRQRQKRQRQEIRVLFAEQLEDRRLLAVGGAVADYQFTNHGRDGQSELFSRDLDEDSVAGDISSPLPLGSTGNGDPPRGLALGSAFDATAEPSPASGSPDYFTFTVTPDSGKPLDLALLTMMVRRNDPDAKNSFSIYYDEDAGPGGDNFATRLFAGLVTTEDRFEHFNIPLEGQAAFSNLTEPITFRYYAWGTAGVSAQRIDNIRLHRSVDSPSSSEYAYYSESGRLINPLDALGNRVPDFSAAGFRHGEESIPNVDALVGTERVVTVSPIAGDDTSNIQSAIDAVAALDPVGDSGFRGIVQLTAGEFQIAENISILTSGILLRGTGDGEDPSQNTVLRGTGTGQRSLVHVGRSSGFASGAGAVRNVVEKYVPVGATSLRVDSTDGWAVGDQVIVRRPSTAAWIAELGMDNIPPRSDGNPVTQWQPGQYDHLYERVITSIEGNRIHLNAPIMTSLETRFGGGTVYKYEFDRIENVGIEAIRGRSDFASDTDEDHAWTFIQLNAVKNAWVSQVTGQHFGYATVHATLRSFAVTVDNARSLDPKSIITGGRRYPFVIDGQFILMQNLYSEEGRHDFVNNSRHRNRGPNVFLSGTAVGSHSTTGPHQRFSTGTLYDTISTDHQTEARNRGNFGSGHGWAGANMVFWNNTSAGFLVQNPPTAQNWLIGSTGPIINDTRFGQQPPANVDAHGTAIDFGRSDNPLNSLYVAQRNQADADKSLQRTEYVLGDFDLRQFDGDASDDAVYADPQWLTAVSAAASGKMVAKSDESASGQVVPFSFQVPIHADEQAYAATLSLGLASTGGSTAGDGLWLDAVGDRRSFESLGVESLSPDETTVLTFELEQEDLSLLNDGLLNLAIDSNTTLDWAHVDLVKGPRQLLTMQVEDAAIREGEAGTTATLTRNSDISVPLNVTLTASDPGEVTLPSQVSFPAGVSEITFPIAGVEDDEVDGTQRVVIHAAAESHDEAIAEIEVEDSFVATLSLEIDRNSLTEGGQPANATVIRNGRVDEVLNVELTSSDPTEAVVPDSITIPAGSESATFEINPLEDGLLDGTQSATISATAAGFLGANSELQILDSTLTSLTLIVDRPTLREGGSVSIGTVTRNSSLDVAIDVALLTSDSTEVSIPDQVTIQSGNTSAAFFITPLGDGSVDGTQVVEITASAEDHSPAEAVVSVTDADVATLSLSVASLTLIESGGETTATVSRNTPVDAPLQVQIAVGDNGEVAVPGSVVIPAGQTSTTFPIVPVDDDEVDGTQNTEISVTAPEHGGDTESLEVLDDDQAIVTIEASSTDILEATGSTTITIRRNFDLEQTLSVRLTSSFPGLLPVPSTVEIPGGTASVDILLETVDNRRVDGDRNVVLAAVPTGFSVVSTSVVVREDDVWTWTNPQLHLDVNDDGFVAPNDVLFIVNYLNAGLPAQPDPPAAKPEYFRDTNSDGFIAPIDVLLIVNHLNRETGGGEGEAPRNLRSEIDYSLFFADIDTQKRKRTSSRD
ncbi:MAG TPA: hypothetical protein DDW52_08740 [Planctomycetaceae bacterium]|nr:hypothetical protein [Planctomycetaceae bacterium]